MSSFPLSVVVPVSVDVVELESVSPLSMERSTTVLVLESLLPAE